MSASALRLCLLLLARAGALWLFASSAGCVSYSTMQTARVLPKGAIRGYFAPSLYSQQLPMTATPARGAVPMMEFGARFGVADELDLGLRLWTYGGQVDAKLQLHRALDEDGGVDVALAPGLGITSIPWSGDIDFFLPLIIGLNLRGGNAILISPKVIGSLADPDLTRAMLGGASFGICWKTGPKMRILPELTVLYPFGPLLRNREAAAFRGELTVLQLGLGFLYDR